MPLKSVQVVRASIPVVAATTVATKAKTKKAPAGGLPATGTSNNQLLLVALLFVVAGSVLLVRRRVR